MSFPLNLRASYRLAAAVCCFSTALAGESLEQGFQNPPPLAHPLVWWHWINGNVTKDGIIADLEDMKRVGIGGAQILDVEIYLPPGPVRYGTDNWHDHVQFAIKKAFELGLEIDIANSPGWSGSGGPWVTPERGMKELAWSETPVEGGDVSLALPQPKSKLDFYRDIAVIAVPPTTERLDKIAAKINDAAKPIPHPAANPMPAIPLNQVINLTGKMDASGKLTAKLPAGKWVILRFGYTATGAQNHPAQPEGHGLEVDKLSVDDVTFQFEHSLGRVIREAGPLAGKTLKGILFDSFEAGFQNWTAKFPDEFKQRKTYDFIPWLPVVTGRIIQSKEASEGALWDFRQVIDDLFAENYFGTMQKLAAPHGIQVYAEAQGGPLNPMSATRHVDVPMNEFWMPETSGRASRMKMVTSEAGFLGRNIIGAEAFTATPENGKYQAVPSTLKNPGDYAFSVGINRFIFHHYTHQPVTAAAPGFALGRYGTHFGRLNTWWPYADAWISYLSRSQFLLQEGKPVRDVCMMVDEDMGYGLASKATDLMPGYDFDVCSPADLRAMTFRDGRVVHPQGQSYALLILPETWVAEISTLKHLRDLVQAGARVLGPAPDAPAGLHDVEARAEFDSLVAGLWGGLDSKTKSKKVGAGFVYQGLKPLDVLKQEHVVPDLAWQPDSDFRFIHRASAAGDIYFVFNHSAQPLRANLTFRQKDRQPEVWDATTGSHVAAPIFSTVAGGLSVPIDFEPYGSAFVIFRQPLPKRWMTAAAPVTQEFKNGEVMAARGPVSLTWSDGRQQSVPLPALPQSLTVPGPWQVSFTDGRGAPPQVVFDQLISWPDHSDAGIKYYSGSALYQTTFQSTAPKPGQVAVLDLGNVADIARVSVNGQSIGVLWKPPFRADITRFLKEGKNTLEVSVANRWINRLIGDESIPVDYAYQKEGVSKFTDGKLLQLPNWLYDPSKRAERKRVSFVSWKQFDPDSPLVPSGLLGPVKLEWFQKIP